MVAHLTSKKAYNNHFTLTRNMLLSVFFLFFFNLIPHYFVKLAIIDL